MQNNEINIKDIINNRDVMFQKQTDLYISTIRRLNLNMRELLKNDFGSTLVRNCARDISGEVVRRYFDMGDYYITVDQMYQRIVDFSYDNDVDLFKTDENIRKSFYNINDSASTSETLNEISKACQDAQKKLFTENREQDKLDRDGKLNYRNSKVDADGNLFDELTGVEGTKKTIIINGKEVLRSDLHADHIQSREASTYNKRYIRQDRIDKLKEFINSANNMQLSHASANTSKGDIRVCDVNGEIKYLTTKDSQYNSAQDITYKATPEQLTEATVQQWEKETRSSSKTTALKEKGYLDENGKVKESVKKELESKFRHSQNAESVEILKATNYGTVAEDAFSATKKSMGKIICGQIIYYVLPPLVFETQTILKKKALTIDTLLHQLKQAGKRVVKYVVNKLGEIFKNIFNNSFNKFLKTFFDIIIETVKATVKKLLKILKQLVISLVNCTKIIADKKATAAEKADAITKTLAVSVTAVVMELLFEYIEKQIGLPSFLIEPLQIIVTILSTNIIMLVLQKADLFDIQYGLLVGNMEKVFLNENSIYIEESKAIFTESAGAIENFMNNIKNQIKEIEATIIQIDIFKEEATPELEKLDRIFDMQIDFNKEWQEFIAI